MKQDILVPNVDVVLLRQQYQSYISSHQTADMDTGLLNLLEKMLDIAEHSQ